MHVAKNVFFAAMERLYLRFGSLRTNYIMKYYIILYAAEVLSQS
jgi:hypothetical protein